MKIPPQDRVWLNLGQAAEHLGVSRQSMRSLLLDEGIPHIRRGQRWMISKKLLDEALDRLAHEQVA